MNVFARIESACARVVEDAFARVFPSALDPAQVGRRLIATAQNSTSDVFLVRVHPSDYERFADDRDFLERRWTTLVREALPEREANVVLGEDADVVAGSLVIEPLVDEAPPALALVRADGTRLPLSDGLTFGRADDNGVVVADARASRRHAHVEFGAGGPAIVDDDSSNGTFVDGAQVRRAALRAGQIVTIGSTNFTVSEA